MKIVRLIIKIFNCVIMAIAALATVFLFASPSLSFNSRVDVNVEKFSQFIPETDYTKDMAGAFAEVSQCHANFVTSFNNWLTK